MVEHRLFKNKKKMNKIFQFNFFDKNGLKYETLWDVCTQKEAIVFAKTHCDALQDCVSYSFSEYNYLDAENLFDVIDGHTFYPKGKLSPTIKDIQDICYSANFWFVQPVSLKYINHTSNINYDNESSFLPIVLIDFNGFVVEILDGYHRFGMAKASGDEEIECLVGFVG